VGRAGAIALLLALLLLLYLPVISGYARTPRKWTPREVSEFIRGVLEYWIKLVERILAEIIGIAKRYWKGA